MKIKLSKIREQQGLTIVDLADACHVSRQTIHSIETGKYKPSVLLALLIAKKLDLKIEDIFLLEIGDINGTN